MDLETSKAILEIISLGLTISGITGGIIYNIVSKYFISKKSYYADKENFEEIFLNKEKAILDEISEFKLTVAKDKANQAEFNKTTEKVDNMDEQLNQLTKLVEIQRYKLDAFLENKKETIEMLKELKAEMHEKFTEVKSDIEQLKESQVRMQLDVQELKTRLES